MSLIGPSFGKPQKKLGKTTHNAAKQLQLKRKNANLRTPNESQMARVHVPHAPDVEHLIRTHIQTHVVYLLKCNFQLPKRENHMYFVQMYSTPFHTVLF